MRKGLTDPSYYSAIASAIRGKNGSTTTYKPSEMAAAITAIPSSGGVWNAVVQNGTGIDVVDSTTGTLYGVSYISSLESTCTGIGAYAFYANRKMTSIYLPNCLSVGASAFTNCPYLTTVLLPKCTTLNTSAFQWSAKIETVDFSALEEIGGNALANNASLKSITLPSIKTIAVTGMAGCSAMTSVSIGPNIASIATTAFNSCNKLNEIHFYSSSQSTVEAMPGYSTLWGRGAGKATVYFDL